MAHVSLIALDHAEVLDTEPRIVSWHAALVEAGHEVELIVVGIRPPTAIPSSMYEFVASTGLGPAADAIEGLRRAVGAVRVVVDASRAYVADDLARLVEPLADGRAEVAVGDGRQKGWRALAALALRPLTGSADPFTGLLGLTADAFRDADRGVRPVGRRFALELLARAGRRACDIPVASPRPSDLPALRLDDLRHMKRLADDRLGNLSRLIQFCVVGASGMVVDLTCYALLQWLFARTWMAERSSPMGPLDLAAARVLSIAVALVWNFTLNRHLTFSYAKKGALLRQFITYVLSNALGVALSFTLSLTLPLRVAYFARHRLAAAVVGIVAATGISFSMSRWVVFRPRRATPARVEPVPAEAVAP